MRVLLCAVLTSLAAADGQDAETSETVDPCACKAVWSQHGYQEEHYCTPNADNGGTADICNAREHLELQMHQQEDCEVDNQCTFDEGAQICMSIEGCGGGACDDTDHWCEVVNPAACADINDNEADVFVWGYCGGDTDDTQLPAGCTCEENWTSDDCDDFSDWDTLTQEGCPATPCDTANNNESDSWCTVARDASCPLWDGTDDSSPNAHRGGSWMQCEAEPEEECMCPIGRRLLVNPDLYSCEGHGAGFELRTETSDFTCPDGSTIECSGPNWECHNADADETRAALSADEPDQPVGDGEPGDLSCTMDVQTCPDGSAVSRDPEQNCSFPACGEAGSDTPAEQTSSAPLLGITVAASALSIVWL